MGTQLINEDRRSSVMAQKAEVNRCDRANRVVVQWCYGSSVNQNKDRFGRVS